MMSVYTPLDAAQLRPLLDQYGLGAMHALQPVQGGIENSNYFLAVADADGSRRELVLTLFEELSPADATFLPPLLLALADAGLPVAAPLATQSGHYQPVLLGKAVQLAPRLAGQHPETPGPTVCRAMGEALARLHLALADHSLQRQNAHGPGWWADMAARWRPRLDTVDRLLLDKGLDDYASACVRFPELPRGLIHGDLFRDNSLFSGDAISGILDFSEAGQDHWLLDIAITVNDFCRRWPHTRLRQDSLKAFLQGYESRRPLLAAEHRALPAFMAVAAIRFWLSRLETAERNARENRGGEHVLEKDPREMRNMLAERLSL